MPHAAGPTRMSRIATDKTIPAVPAGLHRGTRGSAYLRNHGDIDLETLARDLN
jgi:hypothetical protein